MKSIFKTLILAVFPILILSSCSSDDDALDTKKPEINLLSPTDHAHLHLGDVINLEAILKDETELSSIKIDIHYSGDGHQHRNAEVQWNYNHEETLPSGKKEVVYTHNINIPTEGIADGAYHLGVFLIDKAGNQTEKFIEIDVVDHGDGHNHAH